MKQKSILPVITVIFTVVLLTACPTSNEETSDKTYILFKNTEQFPVLVYKDGARFAQIARVPAAGTAKVEAEPNPLGTAFYPRFELIFEGKVIFTQDEAPVTARVDEKKTTEVTIPDITAITGDMACIKIENQSIYSLTFTSGTFELKPLETDSTIVMPNETAIYAVQAGSSSGYFFMRNTSASIPFPQGVTEFQKGLIYTFRYDGSALALSSTRDILQTVLPAVPQHVSATNTSGGITITWVAVSRAASYNVYRAASASGAFTKIGAASGTTYTDTNPGSSAATYYYKIKAVNTAGEGAFSDAASVAYSPSIGNITYSSVSSGTWTVQSDGRRKSPAIAHNGITKSRVSFTSSGATSITIRLDVSSESGCDFAFIGTLDNVSATSSSGYYSGSRISGTNSVTVTIPVPTAGSHFIDIGYSKDGSISSGSDCAWFKVIQ
ncbi:MAG: fibronectin type III domain-containing protein [Treponema sp.]|nr:fibronectin type III domain-containing protein [Treponema sp.]